MSENSNLQDLEKRLSSLEEENKGLRENVKKLSAENEHYREELSMAVKLKYHIMPNIYPAFPDIPSIDVFADSLEVKQVGGDYFDFFRIDSDHIGIVIADIFDGGAASALYMVAFKMYLMSQLAMDETIDEKIATVNDLLCWKNQDNLCLSAWYGRYEISTGKVIAVNAGHEKPLVFSKGSVTESGTDNVSYLLGVIDGMQYESYEFTLDIGDKLFLYTDGVVNACNRDGAAYSLERLRSAFLEVGEYSCEESVALLEKDFREYIGGGELVEDATFLCFARKEAI